MPPLTEEEKIEHHSNEGHDIGVIAQEIELVLPEVVTTRNNGSKAVKYDKIVPLLIQAIKEQQIEQPVHVMVKDGFLFFIITTNNNVI